jgi:hypothetical protein
MELTMSFSAIGSGYSMASLPLTILEERVDVRKNTIHAHSQSKKTHAA